jgi:type II secretory pathway predicted ATPase ExeA
MRLAFVAIVASGCIPEPGGFVDTPPIEGDSYTAFGTAESVAVACGVAPAGSYPMLVRRLQERFETTAHSEGRRPVLVLDESHELSPDVLDMLRILTNFDMDSRLVLSLVIAGQSPLRSLLARDD